MGKIDHGTAETRLQLQRLLPNGQWEQVGFQDFTLGWDRPHDGLPGLREHAAEQMERLKGQTFRIRIVETRYVPADQFLNGSQPPSVPVDLIVAGRELVAAFAGNVPDWLAVEVGMLELALAAFAEVQLPLPTETE